ncbi:UDP-glucose 4-epimerase GalE, partial [Escherichia coli]|nr:UDP-glucose 4-epimerase GalE [Escherichia coli]
NINVKNKIEFLTKRKVKFYECDVCDDESINKIFNNNDFYAVIHLAGLKSVAESIQEPVRYYANNLEGTLCVIKNSIKYNVKKFVFSSSATVYGLPERIPLDENCQVGKTINPYGTSKFFSEQILHDIANANSQIDITILRYFNPVGAHSSMSIGEDPRGIPSNLVPYITKVAAGKLPFLSIFGGDYDTKDGTGVRDYIHVMDLAKGHIAALRMAADSSKSNFHIYNLGTGKGYSVLELVNTFETITGKKINYKICDRRKGDVAECWSDPSLALEELHWKAEKDLSDMLKDAWAWEIRDVIPQEE